MSAPVSHGTGSFGPVSHVTGSFGQVGAREGRGPPPPPLRHRRLAGRIPLAQTICRSNTGQILVKYWSNAGIDAWPGPWPKPWSICVENWASHRANMPVKVLSHIVRTQVKCYSSAGLDASRASESARAPDTSVRRAGAGPGPGKGPGSPTPAPPKQEALNCLAIGQMPVSTPRRFVWRFNKF